MMPVERKLRSSALPIFAAAALLLAAARPSHRSESVGPGEKKTSDPWSSSQTLAPADLLRELANEKGNRPTVVCVGFHTLFAGGHVPGALFHGSAVTEQGLSDLKKWAGTLPHATDLVVYCGCCPFDTCPNTRPAFAALNAMGFKKLRVLVLPANFATDWAGNGYPVEKGM